MSETCPDRLAELSADRLLDMFTELARPWLIRALRDSLEEGATGDTGELDEIERKATEWAARYRARQQRSGQSRSPGKRTCD